MRIIDAHSHLWLKQDTEVDGQKIQTTKNGRSLFFGEEVQMIPPFLVDGQNTAEAFIANMDYAQVCAAVVVQEVIDGMQNVYLSEVMQRYPERFFCYGMANYGSEAALQHLNEQVEALHQYNFKGIAIPAHRLTSIPLNGKTMMEHFKTLEKNKMYLSICLADDETQIRQMEDVIKECPTLKIAIGHFGMATTANWKNQILLAQANNVMIESGGITWLYNSEFYPYPSAVRAIREAADMVGIEKLMWGSDYPRTIVAITYRMSYDFVMKSDVLTEKEKQLFLGENAIRFYNFKDIKELPYIKNMSE